MSNIFPFTGTIINSYEAYDWLTNSSKALSDRASICSAYTKKSILERINSNISSKQLCRVLARWDLNDLISGASDLEAYEYSKSLNWDFYINLNSHVKIYHFPPSGILIGSANATNSGLGISSDPNIEAGTIVPELSSNLNFINLLFDQSIKLNDEIFKKIKNAYEDADKKSKSTDWPDSIFEILKPKISKDSKFFMSELFRSDGQEVINNLPKKSPESKIDLSLLCLNDENLNLDNIAIKFKRSKICLWLKDLIQQDGGYIYFGRVTEAIQDCLIEDPTPYRKEIKILQANLYSWIKLLGPEYSGFVYERPNHSEKLTLK